MRRFHAQGFGRVAVDVPPTGRGQRVGIMGGTFDPPHEGHALAARAALRRLALDRLWLVVTPGNPLKANGRLPPLGQRLAEARYLVGADPRIVVTGFEAELGTPYTAATLRYLQRRLPTVRFVWVMGADNLAGFHRWQDWRGIAETMPIAVVDRPDWRLEALASPAAQWLARFRRPEAEAARLPFIAPPAWVYLTTRLSALSSTELRRSGKVRPGGHGGTEK
jgi:nicotinate-nucleotide adenylyltransferase